MTNHKVDIHDDFKLEFLINSLGVSPFIASISIIEGTDLPSHLGLNVAGSAPDRVADHTILTAETARAYPSESLLVLEDVAGTLPAMRMAEIVANMVAGFGAGDIAVSADRLTFDVEDIRLDAGDRIEGRLPGMAWPSADGLPTMRAGDGW
ncbi:MAG: hypothetical protein AAF371_13725 [Pseudomonadota bacterium]